MSQTVNEVQDEVIEEFSMLDGNRDMVLEYVMELGKNLSPLSNDKMIDENLVKGCQSKVWLDAKLENDLVVYNADSNTTITKGLIGILIRILSGRTPNEIIDSKLYFMEESGLSGFIGTQRTGGLASMIKQMKIYALAFSAKQKA